MYLDIFSPLMYASSSASSMLKDPLVPNEVILCNYSLKTANIV